MKMRNLLIVTVMSAIAFTSCRDNDRTVDEDRIDLEADRNTELRANEQGDDMNTVSTRISENRNLTTFSENMTRNQVTMDSRMSGQGTTTGQGQTGTTAGQSQTGTTTGGQTGTTTGQAGTTGNSNLDSPQAGQGQTGQTQGQGNYTIFAPSNDAYNELSETERNAMMATENRESNVASINYLMVEERLTEENLRQQIQNSNGTYTIRTMQGENLTATMENDEIILRDGAGNEARITETDTGASDGIVHVIDGVLRPEDPTRNEAASRMNRDNSPQTDMERSTNTTGARSQ